MCREIKTIYKAKTKIWSPHDARANCFPNTIIFLKISESPIYGSRSRQTIMLKASIFQRRLLKASVDAFKLLSGGWCLNRNSNTNSI